MLVPETTSRIKTWLHTFCLKVHIGGKNHWILSTILNVKKLHFREIPIFERKMLN